MNKYYLTFGQNHRHLIRTADRSFRLLDKDCIVELVITSIEAARLTASIMFGDKWSDIYTEDRLKNIFPHFPKGIAFTIEQNPKFEMQGNVIFIDNTIEKGLRFIQQTNGFAS